CLSIVAVTMTRFRPSYWHSLGWAFRPIAKQCFLNFRTYVHHRDEPGALFLRGWLSRPFGLPLRGGMIGLPYAFAVLNYDHELENGLLSGAVRDPLSKAQFSYSGTIDAKAGFRTCEPKSLGEFAMERYSGFFARGEGIYVFRAW